MITYIFVGMILVSVILVYREKNWKALFKSVSYLNLYFMTYASINYILSSCFNINSYESRYIYVCILAVFLLILFCFLLRRIINCLGKNENFNNIVNGIKVYMLIISELIFVLWITLLGLGYNFSFDPIFYELCILEYALTIIISILLALIGLKKKDFSEKINDDMAVLDISITLTTYMMFIIAVGSHATEIYYKLFLLLCIVTLVYLEFIKGKKLCICIFDEERRISKNYIENITKLFFPITLFVVMVFCENSLEFYCANINTLPFGLGSFCIDFLRISFAIIIGLCGLLSLLKPQYVSKFSAFIFSLDIAIYIQLMFLNHNLGQTDVTKIDWSEYAVSMIAGLVIWAACLGVGLLASCKKEKQMKNVIKTVSVSLIIVQVVSIVYLFISIGGWSGDLNEKSTEAYSNGFYYLTDEGQFSVSKENVVVFILDTFSNDYMDILIEKDNHALDDFHDFTYYSNYNCGYDGTALAIPHMLSGADFDNTKPCQQAIHDEFSSAYAKEFYNILQDNQIDARLYTDNQTQSWLGVQNIKGYYSNVGYDENVDVEISYENIIQVMGKSIMYRILPFVLKPAFLVVTDDFVYTVKGLQSEKGVDASMSYFEQCISDNKLHLDGESGSFIVYHFDGMHNAAAYSDEDIETNARNNLKLVSAYMNGLRELGVYDDTTIIVTADHGVHETIDGIQPIFMIKGTGQSNKIYKKSEAPIDAIDLLPTVLTCLDLRPDSFGSSIYDIDENMQRERTVYIRKVDDSISLSTKRTNTNLMSAFNCLYRFDYIGDKDDLREREEDKPDAVLPLVDFWW